MKQLLEHIDHIESSLKDFQHQTVLSVMRSFNSVEDQRILVADEVGLGKTIVAKGVIASMLRQRLGDMGSGKKNLPLRVTYICSNLTLAKENSKKLAIFSSEEHSKYLLEPTYSRLLETAIEHDSADRTGKLLEICTLTPSTSFNLTQGHGNKRERLIVFAALVEHPLLEPYKTKLSNLLSDGVNDWIEDRNTFLAEKVLDEKIVRQFHKLLSMRLSDEDRAYCGIELSRCTWIEVLIARFDQELKLSEGPVRLRTRLRMMLAAACAHYLTADLFILDEFQRFRELLDVDTDNEQSLIAKQIFHSQSSKKSKVLLLSATPFKAYTLSDEDEEGAAHAKELNYLLSFLSNSDQALINEYELNRTSLQEQIMRLRSSDVVVDQLESHQKEAIESLLTRLICRTERAQISEAYDSLFNSEVPDELAALDNFSQNEIQSYKAIDGLAMEVQEANAGRSSANVMEFFKASPWPLSFLNGYQFKKDLEKFRDAENVRKALNRSNLAWLARGSIAKYEMKLDTAPHTKTRTLVKHLFNTPSEELLWVPPTMPRYPLQGSFDGQDQFSKTLLFSSWALVPRALSGLVSYEAERRLRQKKPGLEKSYFDKPDRSNEIRFDAGSSLVGWALVYPSKTLTDEVLSVGTQSLDEMMKACTISMEKKLAQLSRFTIRDSSAALSKHTRRDNPKDRWYALAPMLLDICSGDLERNHFQIWKEEQLDTIRKSELKGIDKNFASLCKELANVGTLKLGTMPKDLAHFLALLAVSGPVTSVYRAIKLHYTDVKENTIVSCATRIAFSLLTMFNKPEAKKILRKRYAKLPPFQAIARYSCDGDLDSTLNEYLHLLRGSGMALRTKKRDGYSAEERLIEVAEFHTTNVMCQFSENRSNFASQIAESVSQGNHRHSLRCHYAVPLGSQTMTDDKSMERVSNVRDAFNSPFRPFVLNSTSIGQEGLDFHWYCSQIVHWNLPSNPIDIEQREGRINRYKSLVVRRRVAENYRSRIKSTDPDRWNELFKVADEQTKDKRKSDLVPYWHYPKGAAQIHRLVPLMPLSKDRAKFNHALKVLVLYRLAFGQPRQEELLENLLKRDFSKKEIETIFRKLVINLSPMRKLDKGS